MICSGDQPAGSDLLHLGDDCESKGSSALPGDHQHHDNPSDDHEQPPKADIIKFPMIMIIDQDNLTWTAASATATYELVEGEEVMISYLPVSHIVAQVIYHRR